MEGNQRLPRGIRSHCCYDRSRSGDRSGCNEFGMGLRKVVAAGISDTIGSYWRKGGSWSTSAGSSYILMTFS